VPVVAYATGGVSEGICDGQTGFLVKTGDLATFTDKLELLLRNDALRRSMGEAGRKFVVDRYSLAALAARHESFYLGALARPAS
jgi:glycosyltransferase involved in cell wall biosynthesis